jgi:hypothetical protein
MTSEIILICEDPQAVGTDLVGRFGMLEDHVTLHVALIVGHLLAQFALPQPLATAP